MLGDERLSLELENKHAVYEAGESIMGHVSLTLAVPRLVSSVGVRLRGDSEVSARQGSTRRGRQSVGTEQHFNRDICVFGGLHQLAPGTHTFPFCFTLPEHLPSSFQGRLGRVRYQAEANIECDNWTANHTDPATPFTVISRIDVSAFPPVKTPLNLKQKYSTLLPKRACLRLKGALSRPTLVPGEHFAVIGDISASGAVCARVKLELLQNIKYSLGSDSVTETELVADAEYPRNVQDLQLDLSTMRMRVPELPPSTMPNHSGLVHISYTLRLSARDAVKNSELLKVSCGIVIARTPVHLRPQLATHTTTPISTMSSGYATEDDEEQLLDLTTSSDHSGRLSPSALRSVPTEDQWATLQPQPAPAYPPQDPSAQYYQATVRKAVDNPDYMHTHAYSVQEWDPICV